MRRHAFAMSNGRQVAFLSAALLSSALFLPTAANADWDAGQCTAFLQNQADWGNYPPEQLAELQQYCQNVVAEAAPVDGAPPEVATEAPVDMPPVEGAGEIPAAEAPPVEAGAAPETAAADPSATGWGIPQCEALFADPNAASLFTPEDFNNVVGYCQSIMAVAIPQAEQGMPPADMQAPEGQPQDPSVAGSEIPVDPSAAGTETMSAPTDAASGELLPDPAVGADIPPADAAGSGELLPDPAAEAAGDLLPPADDPSMAPMDAASAAAAGIDVASLPPVAQQGEPVVLLAVTNATPAPLDLFILPIGGSEPIYVTTVEPEYSIVQPTNANRQFFLSQNDEWLGGFTTNADSRQIFKYEGQPR
jgi:hypothetical protein